MNSANPRNPLVLVCSPRRAGNSALAAETFAAACSEAGYATELLFLGDYPVLPCVDCGACASACATDKAGFERSMTLCPLSSMDRSGELFKALLSAPFAALCSPVYFYHLPAQLKALLDRCQLFYQAGLPDGKLTHDIAQRRLYTILVGARTQGKELFRGSLLSLKYALRSIRLEQQAPLLLKGLDSAGALAARPDFLAQIRTYAKNALTFF
jgi:multimeric flavodoxin WrbA